MKANEDVIFQQIYEQTIIRAFENQVNPHEQLIYDLIDIMLWLEICIGIEKIETRIKIVKKVEKNIEKYLNKKV